MSLKILPQFYEELDTQYINEKSEHFLGYDKLDNFPKIYDHIDKLTTEEMSIFSSYMKKATPVYEWMGYVQDPINRNQLVTTVDYSDGVFLWRAMHIYLVENYFIDLPAEFKEHIFSRKEEDLFKYSQEELQIQFQKNNFISVNY